MKRLLGGLAVVLVLELIAAPSFALPKNLRVRTYSKGLNFPVDMAWVKGTKKIFFTEKDTGKVRVMVDGRVKKKACVNLDVNNDSERGALGIVLHPNYADNHKLYVYYTNASPLENRVKSFVIDHNKCTNGKTIVKGIPSGSIHNGGQIEFVHKKLFVSVGEAGDPANAQRKGNRLGKILRYRGNGSIPKGNPFKKNGRRSAVWSYGHRNPFGLAHKPGTKQLFESENGPDCDDEFNRIRKGRNYGWGDGYQCGTAGVGSNPKPPLKRWSSVIVPTDPWWYKGSLGTLNGDIYMGDYHNDLHRLVMNAKGTKLKKDRVIYTAPTGIVDVAKGPRGRLYFIAGSKMYRIVPK
jgi:glucose/arabinose dehydrogenase